MKRRFIYTWNPNSLILTNIIKVSAGYKLSLVLDNTGKVYSWGYNHSGQLGANLNPTISSSRIKPVTVYGNNSFIDISAGYNHALAMSSDYNGWSWGNNYGNKLNDYSTVDQCIPGLITTNFSIFKIISAGVNHTLAIDNDDYNLWLWSGVPTGSTWSWGDNIYGELGNGYLTQNQPPVVYGNHSFIDIKAGFRQSMALDNNYKAWVWGYSNDYLGDNIPRVYDYVCTPVLVYGNHSYDNIAIGIPESVYYNTPIVIDNGHFVATDINTIDYTWSWGNNSNGQLGDNTTTWRKTPVKVCGNHTFTKISAYSNTLAIDNLNKAWAWGRNNYGQLGDNSQTNRCTPVSVYGNHSFFDISAGYEHTLAIDTSYDVWGWGRLRPDKMIGVSNEFCVTPRTINGTSKSYVKVSSNGYHTLILNSSGSLYSFGKNLSGELGDNTTINKNSPVAVCGNHIFTKISAGYDYSSAIDNTGKFWSFGSNDSGQLGDNSTTDRCTPVAVYGNHTFTSIYNGAVHSLAIDNVGKTWSWGYNFGGQLGNNSIDNICTPVAVCGNHTFTSISAGWIHSLAIDNNGKLWSWGSNDYGQLGINSTTDRCTPVAVCGNHTFTYVCAGFTTSFAIDNSGKTWSWGENLHGYLGNNSITDRCTPVAVCGNHTFVSISSVGHTLAIDNTGKLWSWGYNYSGELGDNSRISRCTPVAVCGNHSIISFSVGQMFSTLIDNNNNVWSWGLNNDYRIAQDDPYLDPEFFKTPVKINTLK